jgi:hypothetical protein
VSQEHDARERFFCITHEHNGVIVNQNQIIDSSTASTDLSDGSSDLLEVTFGLSTFLKFFSISNCFWSGLWLSGTIGRDPGSSPDYKKKGG